MNKIRIPGRLSFFLVGLILALTAGAIAYGQAGGGYDLSWSTIDGGGGTASAGSGYSLGGTIGQPDAGVSTGMGGYSLTGGFWGGAVGVTTATPTVAPTQTAGGATATTAPTNTRTATATTQPSVSPVPTACLIIFTDVPPNHTFYSQVRCLACRGIDEGFPCGGVGEPCDANNDPYFRPDFLITRDDLCHMVAGAAGFNEDPGPQHFEDVPLSHPYYASINRMVNRGLISGYPCGTTESEPCIAPDNRPYFHPHANATRGQIAKIVSNGAGFNDPPVGQMFEDVPPTQTFYQWVQRLTSRGVMGGYECGSNEFEPCVGPDNRPYFRWGPNSTRGQVAKITANTFFPNCQTPFR